MRCGPGCFVLGCACRIVGGVRLCGAAGCGAAGFREGGEAAGGPVGDHALEDVEDLVECGQDGLDDDAVQACGENLGRDEFAQGVQIFGERRGLVGG